MRSAHWMPKTEAAKAEAPSRSCRAANVSIRITITGAPTAPAICRAVFVTDEPADTSSGPSRQFSDHVVIGISRKPMPI